MQTTSEPTISANLLEEQRFSVFDSGINANRFWNIKLYSDDTVVVCFGRQGYPGKYTVHEPSKGGRSKFEALIKSKTRATSDRPAYTRNIVLDTVKSGSTPAVPIQRQRLATIVQQQIQTGCKVTAELINYCMEVNIHDIVSFSNGAISYDTSSQKFRTTQGVIDISQVEEARRYLADLRGYVVAKEWGNQDCIDAMNRYLSLVPQNFGMKRTEPRDFLPNMEAVKRQNELLDGLEASFNEVVASAGKTSQTAAPAPMKIFNVSITRLDDPKLRKEIEEFYKKTQKQQHQTCGWKIKEIYKVDMPTIREAFEKVSPKVGNVQKLWHGTKACNLLSILKRGLIIPPYDTSLCAGRLFGNGVYGTDISSKASQYAAGVAPGQSRAYHDRYFMFVATFALGKQWIAVNTDDEDYPMSGYDSTFVKGGHTRYGSFQMMNNEMIVYRTNQVDLMTLVELEP